MTVNQLETIGITFNKWVSLESAFTAIVLSNDGVFYPNANLKFYFSSSGLVYLRRYMNGSTVAKGGLKDSTVGLFHEVYDIDAITIIR